MILKNEGVRYLHMGKEFGARREEKEFQFKDGRVDFDKVIASESFREGIIRIKDGIDRGFVIALMCAEKEPMDCHRFALVSRGLEANGFQVNHILTDGNLISNKDLENKLVEKYKIEYGQCDLFGYCKSYEDAVSEIYAKKNLEIGYKIGEE